MKTRLSVVAIALSTLVAGHALAADPAAAKTREQVRAELAQARANLDLAEKSFERTQLLFKRGASNAQAQDEAQSQQQAARAVRGSHVCESPFMLLALGGRMIFENTQ